MQMTVNILYFILKAEQNLYLTKIFTWTNLGKRESTVRSFNLKWTQNEHRCSQTGQTQEQQEQSEPSATIKLYKEPTNESTEPTQRSITPQTQTPARDETPIKSEYLLPNVPHSDAKSPDQNQQGHLRQSFENQKTQEKNQKPPQKKKPSGNIPNRFSDGNPSTKSQKSQPQKSGVKPARQGRSQQQPDTMAIKKEQKQNEALLMEQIKENKKISKLLQSIKQREQKLTNLLKQQKQREMEIQSKMAGELGNELANIDIELQRFDVGAQSLKKAISSEEVQLVPDKIDQFNSSIYSSEKDKISPFRHVRKRGGSVERSPFTSQGILRKSSVPKQTRRSETPNKVKARGKQINMVALKQIPSLAKEVESIVNSIWHDFDTDRSGKLNRTEAFKFIKQLLRKKGKPNPSYLVYNRYFNEMDINKDGFISKTEMGVFVMNFLAPQLTHEQIVDDMVFSIFKKYDTDGSGTISRREAFKLVNDIRQQNGQRPATHYQFTKIFNEFDSNGDWVLSRKEITQFVRRFLRSKEDDDAEIFKVVNKIWENFDLDRSGSLNRLETLRFINAFFKEQGQPPVTHYYFNKLFKEFDVNNDGFISKPEMARFVFIFMNPKITEEDAISQLISSIFEKYDLDRSGSLNRKETLKLVNDVYAAEGRRPVSSLQFNKIFGAYDVNNDGKISRKEMFKFVTQFLKMPITKEQAIADTVNNIWREYDKDQSGYLNRRETLKFLNDILADQGKPPTTFFQFNQFFSKFDRNRDGQISKPEMVDFVKMFIEQAPFVKQKVVIKDPSQSSRFKALSLKHGNSERALDQMKPRKSDLQQKDQITFALPWKSQKQIKPLLKPYVNPKALLPQPLKRVKTSRKKSRSKSGSLQRDKQKKSRNSDLNLTSSQVNRSNTQFRNLDNKNHNQSSFIIENIKNIEKQIDMFSVPPTSKLPLSVYNPATNQKRQKIEMLKKKYEYQTALAVKRIRNQQSIDAIESRFISDNKKSKKIEFVKHRPPKNQFSPGQPSKVQQKLDSYTQVTFSKGRPQRPTSKNSDFTEIDLDSTSSRLLNASQALESLQSKIDDLKQLNTSQSQRVALTIFKEKEQILDYGKYSGQHFTEQRIKNQIRKNKRIWNSKMKEQKAARLTQSLDNSHISNKFRPRLKPQNPSEDDQVQLAVQQAKKRVEMRRLGARSQTPVFMTLAQQATHYRITSPLQRITEQEKIYELNRYRNNQISSMQSERDDQAYRDNRGGLSIIGEEMINATKKSRVKPKYTVQKGCRHEQYEKELLYHMFRSPKGHRNSEQEKDGKIIDASSVQRLDPHFIASEEMQALTLDQDDENIAKVFVERNKYQNYKEAGKMVFDPYYSDKMQHIKIRRKAIDRVTKKRWRSTMNVFVAICSQYIEDVYVNLLKYLEGGPLVGPSLDVFKMCMLNKRMMNMTKAIYKLDHFQSLFVLECKQKMLKVFEKEPSYEKYQHSKKAIRNFKNSWCSQIFGSHVFSPVLHGNANDQSSKQDMMPRENSLRQQICFSTIEVDKGGGFLAIKNVRTSIHTFQDIYILLEGSDNCVKGELEKFIAEKEKILCGTNFKEKISRYERSQRSMVTQSQILMDQDDRLPFELAKVTDVWTGGLRDQNSPQTKRKVAKNQEDFFIHKDQIKHLLNGYARIIDFGTTHIDYRGIYNPMIDTNFNYMISMQEGHFKFGKLSGFGRTFDNDGGCKVGFWKLDTSEDQLIQAKSRPWGKFIEFTKHGQVKNPEGIYHGGLQKRKPITNFLINEKPSDSLVQNHRLDIHFKRPVTPFSDGARQNPPMVATPLWRNDDLN